ncbi:MAG: (deoxy)nucleoside triphosphate pyrophosphohydrolase [Polyangiaceae bacterium]
MSEKKRIEVAIALVFRGAELLITRRPQGTHLEGYWEFPGGKVRATETPEACAEREVLEEVGLRVRARARRAVIEHDYPERSVRLYPIDCVYEAGEFVLDGVSDARWVALAQLAKFDFPEANGALIAELLADA